MGEKLFDKKTVFFIVIAVIFLAIVVTVVPLLVNKGLSQGSGKGSWSAENQRAFANKLKSEGLADQAALAYEEYLTSDNVEPEVRANTYFMLGESYMGEGAYEHALAYFYKAEIADTKGTLKQDIGINIVTCLEKLGKPLDAQSVLNERVDMDKENTDNTRGAIVARIGGRVITMGEINDELADLPEWYQEKYKEETAKADFIRQYIVNKLLLKKGMMLQYDKDPEIQKQLVKAEESLIVQRVFKENVTDGLSVDAMDLENYYNSHKDEFKAEVDGKEVTKPFEEVREDVRQMFLGEKAEVKMKDFVGRLLQENDAVVFFEPKVEEKAEAATPENTVAEATPTPGQASTDVTAVTATGDATAVASASAAVTAEKVTEEKSAPAAEQAAVVEQK
jgi:tetratricopeptide (TPR) repeat protein